MAQVEGRPGLAHRGRGQAVPHDAEPLLDMRGVSKAFPGVQALDAVDFDLQPGEVHALCGENGAGKSTLMKILAGIHPIDSGAIWIDGVEQQFASPHDAHAAGIAIVTQELTLVPTLDVAANIMLGREPTRHGLLDREAVVAHAREVTNRLGIQLPLRTEAGLLTRGDQQLIEISRALSVDARILIFDEPTSALAFRERELLFDIVEQLKCRGVGVIYISHILPEVMGISDRVTVLRDGERVSCRVAGGMTEEDLIRDMVGKETRLLAERPADSRQGAAGDPDATPVLEVSDLTSARVRDVSFQVAAGEIVGLVGMMGSGRTELLRAIFGLDEVVSGTVLLDGVEVTNAPPRQMLASGMALVPEDRQADGIVAPLSVERNIALSVSPTKRWGVSDARSERRLAEEFIRLTRIKVASRAQEVGTLSGGNQQKVVMSRVLATGPTFLALDEPTAGIDVGAKVDIAERIKELADNGTAVLVASSELPEVVALTDRVLVMRRGRVVASLQGADVSEATIVHHATRARLESEQDA